MSTPDELHRIAIHEAGHVLAHWHFQDEIIAATLRDCDRFSGVVWGHGCSNTIIGLRQKMIGFAAGNAALGLPADDSDREGMINIAQQIHGMTASQETIAEEIKRAEVAATWLVREYAVAIQQVAEALVAFHRLLEGFERRHDATTL
jgi:hypothetical protein